VSNKTNVVMLNGKQYDALTGKIVNHSTSSPSNEKPQAKDQHPGNGTALDGFSRRPKTKKTPHPHAHVSVHQKNERSKTLMRTTVKKPKTISSTSAAPANTTRQHAVKQEPAPIKNNPLRELRAQQIQKSSLISKFGQRSKFQSQPGIKPVAHPQQNGRPSSQTPRKKTEEDASMHNDDIFQSGLDNATSHEQKRPKKPPIGHRVAKKLRVSPRVVNIGASLAVVTVLGGYFTYHNIPNLAMQVASARSGIRGELPKYQPSGFTMKGPIQYQPGQITVSFHSTSDDRSYHLTQRASQWNSEALLEKFVNIDRRPYQTYQDKGKTIYIYEDNNATWVSNGIWYQVEGKSSLNSDQLLRIAGSL
jgi:hypothetical protein